MGSVWLERAQVQPSAVTGEEAGPEKQGVLPRLSSSRLLGFAAQTALYSPRGCLYVQTLFYTDWDIWLVIGLWRISRSRKRGNEFGKAKLVAYWCPFMAYLNHRKNV